MQLDTLGIDGAQVGFLEESPGRFCWSPAAPGQLCSGHTGRSWSPVGSHAPDVWLAGQQALPRQPPVMPPEPAQTVHLKYPTPQHRLTQRQVVPLYLVLSV